MITDKNKNITAIVYNHLNLPTKITFGSTGSITYIYNANGQKVEKYLHTSSQGYIPVISYYCGAFQYIFRENYADYVTKLQFITTSEGYVKHTAGVYSYVFNYTDHLGNVRLSYGLNANVLTIFEESNYYPFGLKHKGYNSNNLQASYKYKYNGKELQDELGLNMYDYGARNYDPALGRWMNVDPLAEQMRRWSPYNYCFNNPMKFTDPDGMGPEIIHPTFQDNATKQAYVGTVEKAMGGMYKVTSDPLINGGNITLTSSGVQGPLTQEQQAFASEYKAVVDSSTIVNQEIVSNDASVTVGSFQSNQMDMSDVAQFDLAGPGAASSAGAVIHETVEQLEKAKMGIPKGSIGTNTTDASGNLLTAPDFDKAHATALKAENSVNGNVRTEGQRYDTFAEKNGNITKQAVIPQAGGTIRVMKQ
jgi:RHS repeat-associated protein